MIGSKADTLQAKAQIVSFTISSDLKELLQQFCPWTIKLLSLNETVASYECGKQAVFTADRAPKFKDNSVTNLIQNEANSETP